MAEACQEKYGMIGHTSGREAFFLKFLHTADLHIGKKLGEYSLEEDQSCILQQMLDMAREEKPDGYIIAGDLYQYQDPSAEAVRLSSWFVSELSSFTKVYLISGNHDSRERISYLAGPLSRAGVLVPDPSRGDLSTFRLDGGKNERTVFIHLLPYLRTSKVPQVLENAAKDPDAIHLLVCHQFISGSRPSGAEDAIVGTLDALSKDLFADFDYVAMGHIHRAQEFRSGSCLLRYAGSPLCYSEAEAGQEKSVTVVECGKEKEVHLSLRPLHPLRHVIIKEGTYEELMQSGSTDYTALRLKEPEKAPLDARALLRGRYPNYFKLELEEADTDKEQAPRLRPEDLRSLSDREIFGMFFHQMTGRDPDAEEEKVLSEILAKADQKERQSV